ncbi:MAG: hypothetical protein IT581_01080 [Verrucomicrobiales bacterium]|nr:hypothetical protein [Verrucomicrobiales bacterium]
MHRTVDGPSLSSTELPGNLVVLQQSSTMDAWTDIAQVFDQLHPYLEGTFQSGATRFYRIQSRPTSAIDDWSNQLPAATPRLFRPGTGPGLAGIAIAKWVMILVNPGRVYFQDTVVYPFHLTFARARLPGYADISAFAYGQQCLYPGPNQRMVVGSVLRAPVPWVHELGLEVAGSATFPADRVVEWLEHVRRRLVLEADWRVFYMPSDEQQAEAAAHRELFEAHGITIDSPQRWASNVSP